MQPFIGKFQHLKQNDSEVIHPKVKNLDAYYKVIWHIEERKQLQLDIKLSTEKWQQYWKEQYKNQNLNLTTDINF